METLIQILDSIEDFILAINNSPLRGPLLSITTIIILLVIKAILTRPVKAYVYKRAFKEENAANFMATWRYIWTAIIAIFGIISLGGSLKTLGISAGFSRDGIRVVIASPCDRARRVADVDTQASI